MKEQDLYNLWQLICQSGKSAPGINFLGINPGQFNPYEGPDFQGAEFKWNGILQRGDVEIHVFRKDWYRHNHHLDNRYDRVMLHLVGDDDERPVTNSKTQSVPSLSLSQFENMFQIYDKKSHCNPENIPAYKIEKVFKNCAYKRLQEKSAQTHQFITEKGLYQGLYFLFMRSMGLRQNVRSFEMMTDILTWSLIAEIRQRLHPPLEYWLTLFWGAAGFLPARDAPDILNELWCGARMQLKKEPLNPMLWQHGGVRPVSHPQNRLAGMAHFVAQNLNISLFDDFYDLFIARPDPQMLVQKIKSKLIIRSSAILPGNRKSSKTLWGESFINEITGNVFIPFFYHWSVRTKSYGFQKYIEDLYYYLPLKIPYSSIVRHPVIKKLYNPGMCRFYYMQGIIYFSKNYCQPGNCLVCPFYLKK